MKNDKENLLTNILFDEMTPNQFKRFTKEYDELYNNGWQMETEKYRQAIIALTRDCLNKSIEEKNQLNQ